MQVMDFLFTWLTKHNIEQHLGADVTTHITKAV